MPGPNRRYSGKVVKVKKGTIKRLLSHLLKYKFRYVILFVTIIVSSITTVSISVFLKNLIDVYISGLLMQKSVGAEPNFAPLIKVLIGYSIFLFFGVLCNFIQRFLNVYLSQNVLLDFRNELFAKIENLPIQFFDKNNAGDLMSRFTNDVDTLRQVVAESFPMSFASIVTFISICLSMITMSLNLFAIVVIVTIGMLIYTKKASTASIRSYGASLNAVSDLNGYVEEMINGAKEVKVFCYEDRDMDAFISRNEVWRKMTTKADTLGITMMPFTNACGNFIYVLIAFLGGMMALNNVRNIGILGGSELTLGMIAGFLTYTKNFTSQIAQLSSQLPFIFQSMSGAQRIFDIMDELDEKNEGYIKLVNIKEENGEIVESNKVTNFWGWKDDTKDNNKYTKLEGDIVLTDVNFSYVRGKRILKNINIYAHKGQKIALVGKTGSGKTTITNLLNRFYEIDSGLITYDGIDIKKINKIDLRDSIALVLQDVHLFTGTILDNIRFGRLDATDEECIDASKLAGSHNFIMGLEKGYNTILSGGGSNLSQGQRQLLSIARAAVANPPVMILDEATSNIDTRTEKIVQDGMDSIMKGRTVFVIAHRLSTIKNSDAIMVIDNGEIIERGTHTSLLEKGGIYYQLYTGKLEID